MKRQEQKNMHIAEGMTVDLTDGKGGHVTAVVLEPIVRRVSHLVVSGAVFPAPRLVPAESIVSCTSGRMQLSLRQEELERCHLVQQIDVFPGLPQPGSGWEVGIIRGRVWPVYDSISQFGACPASPAVRPTAQWPSGETTWIYDRIPAGHVELRRKSTVVCRDYRFVGHLGGLVVDPSLRVTQLVLEKGHLWRHRGFTVPIGEIQRFNTDLVRLGLTRAQVDTLRSAGLRTDAELGDAA